VVEESGMILSAITEDETGRGLLNKRDLVTDQWGRLSFSRIMIIDLQNTSFGHSPLSAFIIVCAAGHQAISVHKRTFGAF